MTSLDKEHNICTTDYFSSAYPLINKYLVESGDAVTSRYGDTREVLNFVTKINDPIKRCVGGYMRNINIFFLLAEAMWIWVGRKDVEFLTIFNSKMKEFSDDGKTFHAPYGYRLRSYGVHSRNVESIKIDESKLKEIDTKKMIDMMIETGMVFVDAASENMTIDQMAIGLGMLDKNSEDRRVVMSIWNPELDLGKQSLDIPCNDLLMFKIRKNKLHLTICNRSNDLHWGLPTNVFQFSFILEIMSRLLKVEVGTQTHISQSLHYYVNNPIADTMQQGYNNGRMKSIYDDSMGNDSKMEFQRGSNNIIAHDLKILDANINLIISFLIDYDNGRFVDENQEAMEYYTQFYDNLDNFSSYFFHVCKILEVYMRYRKSKRNDDDRMLAYEQLKLIRESSSLCGDYYFLAQNWFAARLNGKVIDENMGKY